MLDEMVAEEQRFLNRSTMQDDRENNFISTVTDEIFLRISASMPDERPGGKKKRYVTPIMKHRVELLETALITGKIHIVDQIVNLFELSLKEKMEGLMDKHFLKIEKSLEEFSNLMPEHGPVPFMIEPQGEKVRAELEKQISYIEGKAEALQDMLPVELRQENRTLLMGDDMGDDDGEVKDLSFFINKVSKDKRKADSGATVGRTIRSSESKSKKIKEEQ